MTDEKLSCDICGADDCSTTSKFKKVWICDKCMDDLYPFYKTHLIVKRCMMIYKKIEEAINEINE